MTTRTTTQINTPEDKRAIYVRKFLEKADIVPDTIHKAWDAMTADEQATVIWYQVRFSDSITRPMTPEDSQLIGKTHSYTMRMTDLARTIMRLHPGSPSRVAAINEYVQCRTFARVCRDAIICRETRKLANFWLRTVGKPVDNAGNPIIS